MGDELGTLVASGVCCDSELFLQLMHVKQDNGEEWWSVEVYGEDDNTPLVAFPCPTSGKAASLLFAIQQNTV